MKFKKKDEHTYELDVKGYVCPHPQLYTMKTLQKIKSGDVLEVIFDNPTSEESISALIEKDGHKVLEHTRNGVNFYYKIQKA